MKWRTTYVLLQVGWKDRVKHQSLLGDLRQFMDEDKRYRKTKLTKKKSTIAFAQEQHDNNLKNWNDVCRAYPERWLCTKQECLKHAIIHVRSSNGKSPKN